jgi:hypothetical protein
MLLYLLKWLSFTRTKISNNLSNVFKDKIEVYLGRRQSRQAKEVISIHTVKFSANKCLIKKGNQEVWNQTPYNVISKHAHPQSHN